MKRVQIWVLFIGFLFISTFARAHPLEQLNISQPQYAGEIIIQGLKDQVEILRDAWGVAHIYASSSYDLFFAQGYTQAQDRWWQMELWRHSASGRLGELLGKSQLGQDIATRILGGARLVEEEIANHYDSATLAHLQAFADGVNAYLETHTPPQLAVEYTALQIAGIQIDIKAWTVADSLIWGKYMALNQGGNMDIEMLLSALSQTLTPVMLASYGPPFPYGEKPTILADEDLPLTVAAGMQQDTAGIRGIETQIAGGLPPDFDFGLGRGKGIGSNNWVVSGAMTTSGKPMIANDPHLGILMPSIWYEIGLHCRPVSEDCPFDVVGFAFSPTPGVIIGHNQRIGWAMTNVIPDVQDLYVLRINPENPLQYEWNGIWRDMTTREETIRFVDNSPTVTITVRLTHLGPIINDYQIVADELQTFNNKHPLALRWTALEPGTLFEAVMKINQAQNWEEFRNALRLWDAPAQNFVFADIDGNIGYQTPGRLPIRAKGHTGILPVPGWIDNYEWRGYIPFDKLPRIFNPPRGFIVTANQAVVPPAYYQQLAAELGEGQNYTFSYFTAWGYRAQRINELIIQLAPHSPLTFKTIQGDNKSISAEELLPYLAQINFDDRLLNDARDWLLTWDYQMHMDSPQAALYAQFWASLVAHLYNDQFAGLHRATGNDNELRATYLLMDDPTNIWWDNINTPDIVETRDDILKIAFAEGYANTLTTLGEDRTAWRWGALHTATFVNLPLGRSGVPLAENLVNRGPVAASGGGEIINATSWNAGSGGFKVNSVPSMRMILDFSNFDNSLSIHTTGQSGNPASPHYDDMIDLWRLIEYRPMLWSREQVNAQKAHQLLLLPG